MKNKTTFIFLPVLFALIFLSAFSQPAPLFALPLPEGRSLDETHNTGYIDWSGAVGYINLFHRDGICNSGCTEQVTRIINGASVSGAFAGDVVYFEVGVSASHSSSVGSAILTACSSSDTLNLHTAGSGPPGFVSFSLVVPSGCRSWSLRAAGGYVDFRSVDANYGSPPPMPTGTKTRTATQKPPATVTATQILTKTSTKTLTLTPTPFLSLTPTPSPSVTLTPTASETLAPGVTPSDTFTPTITATPLASATFTASPILTKTYTLSPPTTTPTVRRPANTSTRTYTPIGTQRPPRRRTNTPVGPGNQPTRTRLVTSQLSPTTPPPAQTRTLTPRPGFKTPTLAYVALNASPTSPCDLSAPGSGGSAGGFPVGFSWLGLLTAAGSLAAALSLLRSIQKGTGSTILTVRVPHLVQRTTTVGEWVSRPVKIWVLVTSTIWRAVVTAIPHFIDVLRQVVDQIFHSEWVTSTIWVLQTIYQNVWEQVPLLSWLGTIIGWLWQWVVKPILTWVAQTIQTLYTWVENVVRWVVERIQDGWDYITHWVAETVSNWVEQTSWVKEWVTKEITVWETEWETVPVTLPAALSPDMLKILAKLGLTVTFGILSLTECVPTTIPTPVPDYAATMVPCLVKTAQAGLTQTVIAAYTPTPIPTSTATPFVWPTTTTFTATDKLYTCNDVALYYGISVDELKAANPDLNCDAVNIGTTKFNIPPVQLKTPSDDVSQYSCTPTTDKPKCLSPDATAEEMIAYTLFNEGGSSEGSQFSADVMQVMLNHANKILDNWGIDRSQMSRDDYAKLVLYVISKPAAAGADVAAFEAFSSPSAPPNDYTMPNWDVATQIAQAVLDDKGKGWGDNFPLLDENIAKQDVLFYCSVSGQGDPPLGSSVRIPVSGSGPNGIVTYFFNGYQYDQSVAQWCQDNR